jgi:hypothetical protein
MVEIVSPLRIIATFSNREDLRWNNDDFVPLIPKKPSNNLWPHGMGKNMMGCFNVNERVWRFFDDEA